MGPGFYPAAVRGDVATENYVGRPVIPSAGNLTLTPITLSAGGDGVTLAAGTDEDFLSGGAS